MSVLCPCGLRSIDLCDCPPELRERAAAWRGEKPRRRTWWQRWRRRAVKRNG